ncbi:hypothetical protein HanPSC8_Chr03g0122211 [Helianthus annuus]|nr:hypothetical protein HanPSC8_Chr03g0122211 [Helianthus annuus]
MVADTSRSSEGPGPKSVWTPATGDFSPAPAPHATSCEIPKLKLGWLLPPTRLLPPSTPTGAIINS